MYLQEKPQSSTPIFLCKIPYVLLPVRPIKAPLNPWKQSTAVVSLPFTKVYSHPQELHQKISYYLDWLWGLPHSTIFTCLSQGDIHPCTPSRRKYSQYKTQSLIATTSCNKNVKFKIWIVSFILIPFFSPVLNIFGCTKFKKPDIS